MASFGANLYLVPIVLKVKTSEEITRVCYLNNSINGQKYNYALPSPYVKGFYEIHFFADIREWKDPNDIKNETLEVLK